MRRVTKFRLFVAVIGLTAIVGLGVLLSIGTAAAQHQDSPHGAGVPGAVIQTHHEAIPNPVYNSDFTVAATCQTASQPCNWNDPDTWQTASVPGRNDLVIVDGNVQISDREAVARSIGIYPGGTLSFAPDTRTKLFTGDLLVLDGGTLVIGTSTTPIDSSVRAEVVFRNLRLRDSDPEQHLRGLIVLDGTVRVFGHPLEQTFLRTAIEPGSGSNTITTTESMTAAGWSRGDWITIPTSQQCTESPASACQSQTEDRRIIGLSNGGRTATLDSPLTYAHPAARDHDGQIDFLPHVINKSRNVIFRSKNPSGTRSHILFHGRADVDMRYAEVRDMGRTSIENLGSSNQKGRYPIHAHHLIGPHTPQANGYQFTLIGNLVDFGEENTIQGRKWGISIHESHYGLIEGNVVDRASGAAIVTESGSEKGNMFRNNFVVRVVGGNEARTADLDPSDGTKSGRAGVGYWFNGGGLNSFHDNVVADVAECVYCFGFKFDNVRSGTVVFPTSQGADPYAGSAQTIDGNTIALNDFVGNEAYAVPNGMTIWWQCTFHLMPVDGCSSHVESFQVWHHHRWGYYGYETANMTLDGFIVRGDLEALSNQYESVRGLEFGDYMQRNLRITNADIQNMRTAIRMPTYRDVPNSAGPNVGVTTVEDSYLVATEGIGIWAPSSVNQAPSELPPQTSVIRNVQFEFPTVGSPNDRRGHIVMRDTSILLDPNKTSFAARNDVLVENYNQAPGVDGDNFYVIPDYQGPSRCDSSIADCANELTAEYDRVVQGHVYPLSGEAPPQP